MSLHHAARRPDRRTRRARLVVGVLALGLVVGLSQGVDDASPDDQPPVELARGNRWSTLR